MKSKMKYVDAICVSFTVLALLKIILEWIILDTIDNTGSNLLFMFIFTCLSMIILSSYKLFEKIPTLIVMAGQYVIAMGIVFGIVWISGLFSPLSEGAYLDIFISFTIPYVIGSILYYVQLHLEVKNENSMLERIKNAKK